MSRVRELANHYMSNPGYVTIDYPRVKEVALVLKDFKLELPTWDFPPFYPQSQDFEEMCLYYLLFSSINYCYFDEYGNKFTDGKLRSSTLAGLRITENWEDLKNMEFLAHVDPAYMLGELFKADVPISLVSERAAAFREIGEYLLANPDFTFRKMFARMHDDAYMVSHMIPVVFPTWEDPFYKRAQLFVGMVEGRFPGTFKRLEELTVFADYRIPQTLHSLGILNYSGPLITYIGSETLIPVGSQPEVELRAATIVACDALTEELNEFHGGNLNILHTDYLLWSAMRGKNDLPAGLLVRHQYDHHRTMTTHY